MFVFRAMNTDVAVVATSADADEESVALRVSGVFRRAEARFSRFRTDSELSRLNRSCRPMRVSRELFDALARARAYVETTNGLFDPAVGGALLGFGYDRSFAPGALDRQRGATRWLPGHFLDVKLDASDRSVERPAHVQIDLGGMVKGSTVDLAAEHLGGSGAIDAGGDAVLSGLGPDGEPWLVEIEDPANPSRTIASVAGSDCAVATSAANRRSWQIGTSVAHHLIDPRTQSPAVTDLAQATVISGHAELSDVLAKTAFLLGDREGRRFLERQPGTSAVLVRRDGRTSFVGELDVREVSRA